MRDASAAKAPASGMESTSTAATAISEPGPAAFAARPGRTRMPVPSTAAMYRAEACQMPSRPSWVGTSVSVTRPLWCWPPTRVARSPATLAAYRATHCVEAGHKYQTPWKNAYFAPTKRRARSASGPQGGRPPLDLLECLQHVGREVADILDADREANDALGHLEV